MQLGCLESVANSTVAYSSSSPLTYSTTGTDFATPYFSTNHQYTPLHHQSFHYEFQHSHPAVNPDAYSLNSLHHSQQYYQQIHHGEPADFINLHNARALKSSCLDEQRRELGCLDAYRRHDLSLMSHGTQYGMHPDQRLLPGPSLGLGATGADDLQVNGMRFLGARNRPDPSLLPLPDALPLVLWIRIFEPCPAQPCPALPCPDRLALPRPQPCPTRAEDPA